MFRVSHCPFLTCISRYDARLLLDSLPDLTKKTTVRQCSPTGWTDVSSDEEDMFFFTEEEIEDFRRDKRRKMIEKAREDRMKALEDEDFGDTDGPPGKSGGWGGSDEEVPPFFSFHREGCIH